MLCHNKTDVYLNILWRHPLQELDVFLRVEPSHVVRGGDVWAEDLHLLVQAVVQDQRVGDAQPVWLHRVAGTVVKVSYVRIVKVNDLFLRTHFVKP